MKLKSDWVFNQTISTGSSITCVAVDTVVVALFFEELPEGKIRLSARSKDDRIDVNKICGEFGGGGHPRAAGARIRGNLEEVRNKVLKRVFHEIAKSL